MTGNPLAGSYRGTRPWAWQSDQPWSGGGGVSCHVAIGYGYYSGCRNPNKGYLFSSFEVDILPAVVTEIFCLAIGVGGVIIKVR